VTPNPSTNRCHSTIVVPCYNEAARFQPEPFLAFLADENPATRQVSFLFVNDGSADGTLAVLESLVAAAERLGQPGRISILDKKRNGGKGEAIRDGMLAAIRPSGPAHQPACDYVGFWDADLATPLSAIPQFLQVIEGRPSLQMIFGSRIRLLGRTIRRNPARHYLGRIFATAASQTLSLPIYDTQCGAKIFKVSPDLAQVLAAPFISRWIFDVELVARFIQLRGRESCFHSIYEFPLDSWEDVAGSKVGPLDFFYAAFDIFRIYRRYLAA
jgi:glycosyltransferase involved in cell wall biosynthesis